MASQTKKRKRVKDWKDKPNKANLKAYMKRIKSNTEILKKLAQKDES
ncbi:MAG: hypothetical protein SV375_10160 [Thermodesulfobacteriota bacterium]|nr:hypothetical protein [Thermodesulfobacteriota bacterium]